MFSRKKEVIEEPVSPEPEVEVDPAQAKKGRPTPKRKDAEAANKRPLVPADRTQAAKVDKAARREARALQQRAMETGDEKHMPAQHAGKERRYIRDYVDARFSLAEFLLPALLLVLVLSLVLGNKNEWLMVAIMLLMYGMIIVAAIDGFLAIRRMKKQMIAKWGREGYPRGSASYAFSRLIQLRRLRMPKPVVARGQFPS